MPIVICEQTYDVLGKQEIITLVDCFGQKQVVQFPMTDGKDYSSQLEAEMAAMSAREQAFITALKARGLSLTQINSMMKTPGDCGCSKS